jgi:aminopeptidase N
LLRTDTPPRIHLKDYRPPDYLVDNVDLDVRLDPERTEVRSVLRIRPNPDGVRHAPLVLDGEDLELISIAMDGIVLTEKAYTLGNGRLTLAAVPAHDFTVVITTLCNPVANTQLSGLYLTNGVYCTQCEAEGFRRITYFPDRPDVLSVYTVRIEADKANCPVLLSNGNPADAGDIAKTGRHFAIWHDPHPKPSYLFALVGGVLGQVRDTFTTASGAPVDLRIYMEPGKEDRCAYAMEALKRAMRWDEMRFGLEYDLDVFMIVAVPDFNMGAMENKGLNVFNDKCVLANAETATDAEFTSIEAIIAHEYFHNWTGNRVTCRDWFQLCLKEGLTVYRDQEFTADMGSRAVARIRDVRTLRTHQFPEDAGPLAHPVRPQSFQEINNFYTATVYEKGAELVRMIATMIGIDGFRKGIDLYFKRCDGTAATVEDFILSFEDANSVDLGQFRLWYEQAGTPELKIDIEHDAATATCTLTASQIHNPSPDQPNKKPVHIPMRFALLGANGAELPLEIDPSGADNAKNLDGDILHLRADETSLVLKNIPLPPVASALRGFSAPVRLAITRPDEDLGFLIRHDSDSFNRWEAAHTFAMRILVARYNEESTSTIETRTSMYLDGLRSILEDPALEPAYKAEFLSLPGATDVAGEIARDVDPDKIAAARNHLRIEIGETLAPLLRGILAQLDTSSPYSPDPESAGKRALYVCALGLLCASGDAPAAALARDAYVNAGNMTEMMAALSVLTHIQCDEREASMLEFATRFSEDSLVMDKWFTLQAISEQVTVLEDIKALMAHPAFSLKTPNRVRALIGAFAVGNFQNFHRGDGAGYDLVTRFVQTLDPINPQIAARLLGQFNSWRQMEPGRRMHAESALKFVAGIDNLSPDVSEMATRCLAENT